MRLEEMGVENNKKAMKRIEKQVKGFMILRVEVEEIKK